MQEVKYDFQLVFEAYEQIIFGISFSDFTFLLRAYYYYVATLFGCLLTDHFGTAAGAGVLSLSGSVQVEHINYPQAYSGTGLLFRLGLSF